MDPPISSYSLRRRPHKLSDSINTVLTSTNSFSSYNEGSNTSEETHKYNSFGIDFTKNEDFNNHDNTFNEKETSPVLKLLNSVLLINNDYYIFKQPRYFDEISYNIVHELLNDQFDTYNKKAGLDLFKQYKEKNSKLLKISDDYKLSDIKLSNLNIQYSNNDYSIKLINKYSYYKIYCLINEVLSLVKHHNRLIMSMKDLKTFKFLIIFKLFNLKKFLLNQTIYYSILQIKSLEIFKTCLQYNEKVNKFWGKILSIYREWDIYNSNFSFNNEASLISTIPTNIINNLVFFIKENLKIIENFLLKEISLLLLNSNLSIFKYFENYNINLKVVYNKLNEYHQVNHKSNSCQNNNLKPLNLAIKSPKITPNIDLNVSNNNNEVKQFNELIKSFQIIFKTYLISWLIKINESVEVYDFKNVENDDFYLLQNILNLSKLINNNNLKNFESKNYLIMNFFKKFDKFLSILKNIDFLQNNYIEINNLTKIFNSQRIDSQKIKRNSFESKVKRNSSESSQKTKNSFGNNKNDNICSKKIINELSNNLNKINYKISILENDLTNNNFNLIENDLMKLINNYSNNIKLLKTQSKKIDNNIITPRNKRLSLGNVIDNRFNSPNSFKFESPFNQSPNFRSKNQSPNFNRLSTGFSLLKIEETKKEVLGLGFNKVHLIDNEPIKFGDDIDDEEIKDKKDFENELIKNFEGLYSKDEKKSDFILSELSNSNLLSNNNLLPSNNLSSNSNLLANNSLLPNNLLSEISIDQENSITNFNKLDFLNELKLNQSNHFSSSTRFEDE